MDDRGPEELTELEETELLLALRGGNQAAYEELWHRHYRAALTFAAQVAPGRAEDLTSEAFLAVLHTITVSNKGPVNGFRAYLFATMRNTAHRWYKESTVTIPVADPELMETNGTDAGPSPFETAEYSENLAKVFKELPERWQQALWLAEVDGASRSEISAELGIRPNAVSALLRRARHGLRLRWLAEHIPERLRDDKAHAGYLLPEMVIGKLSRPKKRLSKGTWDSAISARVCTQNCSRLGWSSGVAHWE